VENIVAAVNDALVVPKVEELHLEASTGFESWLGSVSPSSHAEVSPGDTVEFDLSVCVPSGASDGEYNFTISAVDDVGVSFGDQEVNVTVVTNEPPAADPNGPYLGAVGSPIAFDGSASSDPDGDPLTYAWTFGDGNTGTGVTPSHAYAGAGIYDVCLTVNDGQVNSAQVCTIAVVYDPDAGFVTGGGWIDSPAGAYEPDPALAGKANFGFVSKYKKGADTPTGNTEFQFHAGDLNFHSSVYEWLVVTGSDYAKFKGAGAINGAGDYKFMLWAGDSEPDTFRIKIWEEDEFGVETVIYDNGFDQAIAGGSIVIHTKDK
jgi:chitodextrinase